jgi:hypothetical protein
MGPPARIPTTFGHIVDFLSVMRTYMSWMVSQEERKTINNKR